MAGYLDQYGAGYDQRAKIVKRLVLSALVLLVVGGTLFFFFKNYRQEKQAQRFFELLAAKDYRAAHALWGCTETRPCPDYSFDKFMEDWGPNSPRSQSASFKITRSRSCGSGVILTIDGGDQEEKLWVEKKDLTIAFSPWPGCPPGI